MTFGTSLLSRTKRVCGHARARPAVTALLALIVVVGGALRVDAVGTAARVSVDERSYLGIANNLALNHSYAYGNDPRHWAPGAPFLFASVMAATGTAPASNAPREKNAVLYAQAGVSTLAILAVFALAAWLAGPLAGLLGAAMTALYDPLILAGRSYLTEPLGGLLLLAAVTALCVVVARDGNAPRWSVAAGVLLGLTVLTRNDMLLLLGIMPVAAGLLIWRSSSLQRGMKAVACIGAAAAVTIAPWVAYASLEEGRLTPVTTAGPSSLWVATYLPAGGRQIIVKRQFMDEVCRTFPDRRDACGVTATQLDMRLIFELLQRRHPGMTRDEAVQAELDRNIREYALGQPVEYAQMLASKATRIWGRPWGGGAIGRQESSLWEHRLFIGLAAIGVLAGLLAGGRQRRYLALAALAVLSVTVINTVFVSESRMSLRMTPLLLAAGAGGLGAALSRARAGRSSAMGDDARCAAPQSGQSAPV